MRWNSLIKVPLQKLWCVAVWACRRSQIGSLMTWPDDLNYILKTMINSYRVVVRTLTFCSSLKDRNSFWSLQFINSSIAVFCVIVMDGSDKLKCRRCTWQLGLTLSGRLVDRLASMRSSDQILSVRTVQVAPSHGAHNRRLSGQTVLERLHLV